MMADASDFDFDFELPDDDGQPLPQDVENEFYLFGKVMTPEEEDLLRKHKTGEAPCPAEIISKMAARYQRGELGQLLPVVGPYLPEGNRELAADFFSTIEEQSDENVLLMYRMAVGWASDLAFPIPHRAPPIDERPMDLIEVEHPWPDMSSIAVH